MTRRDSTEKLSIARITGANTTAAALVAGQSGLEISPRLITASATAGTLITLSSLGIDLLTFSASEDFSFPEDYELPLQSGIDVRTDGNSAGVILHYVGYDRRAARANPDSSVSSGGDGGLAEGQQGDFLTEDGPVGQTQARLDTLILDNATSITAKPIPAAGANYFRADDTVTPVVNPEDTLIANLSQQPIAWWKGDGTYDLHADNNIENWYDETENNHDLTSVLGETNEPTLVTNVLNGKPIARFDGINDHLELDDINGLLRNNFHGTDPPYPTHFVALLRITSPPAPTNSSVAFSWMDAGTGSRGVYGAFATNGWAAVATGNQIAAAHLNTAGNAAYVVTPNEWVLNQWHIVVWRFHTLTHRTAQLDYGTKSDIGGAVTSAFMPDLFTLGRYDSRGSAGNATQMDLAEMLVFRTISDDDGLVIRNYFAEKWGIEV